MGHIPRYYMHSDVFSRLFTRPEGVQICGTRWHVPEKITYATGNTLLCNWRFEPVKDKSMHVLYGGNISSRFSCNP